MATIRSYTTIEQSKKLAEILPLESADMHWQDASKEYENPYGIYDRNFRLVAGNSSKIINNKHDFRKGFILPAWSLAALLGVLPEIQGGKPIIALDDNYITYPHMSDLHTKADNLVDACVAMIELLHEQKLL